MFSRRSIFGAFASMFAGVAIAKAALPEPVSGVRMIEGDDAIKLIADTIRFGRLRHSRIVEMSSPLRQIHKIGFISTSPLREGESYRDRNTRGRVPAIDPLDKIVLQAQILAVRVVGGDLAKSLATAIEDHPRFELAWAKAPPMRWSPDRDGLSVIVGMLRQFQLVGDCLYASVAIESEVSPLA
jgi:hypothetical protein